MADYFAFGGCLRSELEFPDLSPCPPEGLPDRFVVVSDEPPGERGVLQGEREVEPGWTLRLHRLRSGWRLDYEDTGSYAILDAGRRIVWHRGTDRREEVIRAVILGPVMALALHETGVLTLHGSAIRLDRGGVGFLAPKGYGKSSLAAALAVAGGRLMSDDLVAIDVARSRIFPGVHSVRIRADVRQLVSDRLGGARVRDGRKNTLTNLPADRLAWDAAPLEALYVLEPVTDTAASRTTREQIEPYDASVALLQHTKLVDELVGFQEAGKMLRWIATLVANVPTYRLQIPRSLDRLDEVADTIRFWHEGPAPADRV